MTRLLPLADEVTAVLLECAWKLVVVPFIIFTRYSTNILID